MTTEHFKVVFIANMDYYIVEVFFEEITSVMNWYINKIPLNVYFSCPSTYKGIDKSAIFYFFFSGQITSMDGRTVGWS